MAEAVVALAVQRITDLVIEEAAFLHGVQDEVHQLQVELKRMQCLLKDADHKQDQDERIRSWLAEIRNLAYDAEDVIHTFLLKVAAPHTGVLANRFIKKATSMFTKAFYLHEIGKEVKSIQLKIVDITRSMQTYGINPEREGSTSASEMQRRMRITYPHDVDDHIFSFDAIIRDLKAQLMMEEDRLCVVSIVGMGGSGKTTLAKKVYNESRVKKQFDCYSWAFISEKFSIKDVIVGILMDVASSEDKSKLEEEKAFNFKLEMIKEKIEYKSMLERMKEDELIKTLYDVLEEKRYLVVLDDIWTNEAWGCLKAAFPNGKRGSKVLFTTRNKEVASHADPWSPPIEPPFLTNDDGWKLLSRKAFSKDTLFKDGSHFEKLGRELVKKCRGLPLAIVVLGGLLATKKSLNEWEAVQRNINAQFIKWEQQHQYEGVYRILALSYDDLPFHLKPCFLYLSQFPKDTEFHKRALIRMWIAEGFISQQLEEQDQTMEDVAEQYWKELVSRCMVQVSRMDHTGIGVKTCCIHDLVRDMCITKARDENFFRIFEHPEHTTPNNFSSNLLLMTSKSRRISIHPHISGLDQSRLDQNEMEFFMPLLTNSHPNLRSLTYFVEREMDYGITSAQGIFICKQFVLLRVLNIGGVNFCVGQLPREIGNLIHLRYLGLRGTKLNTSNKSTPPLPAAIGNLKSLYTLDLRNNDYRLRLPDVLWRLECLRHLLVDNTRAFEHLQLHTIRHLETLKSVYAQNLIRKNTMLKLTNLRNLGIYFQKTEEVEVVLKSPIFRLGRLQSLKMWIIGNFPNLEPLSSCPHLTKVELVGAIPEVYDPHSQHHNLYFLPTSLAKLTLSGSELKQDPMGILEKLPNLRFLSLKNKSFVRFKMVCSADGFRQLDILELYELRIQEWEIEEGAMPCLKTLSLVGLKNLSMIPQGLKFVTTLQELKFINMPEIFKTRVQVIDGIEGEDFQHRIPSISFSS